MSYARFGADDSDVYVFEHYRGSLECCGCWLSPRSYNSTDVQAFLWHLEEHRAAGHCVPEYVLDEIEDDWRAGEFDWADAPYPAEARP